jgi:hypothetical protein
VVRQPGGGGTRWLVGEAAQRAATDPGGQAADDRGLRKRSLLLAGWLIDFQS